MEFNVLCAPSLSAALGAHNPSEFLTRKELSAQRWKGAPCDENPATAVFSGTDATSLTCSKLLSHGTARQVES